MMILALATLLFCPPMYMAGLFGMNIQLPWQDWPNINPAYDPNASDLPWQAYSYGYIPFVLVIGIAWTVSFIVFLIVKYNHII